MMTVARERGVTLVELLVVISIIGILVIALGFSYVGWQGAYKVEKATKDMYADLMDARNRAITRGETYFADFNTPAPPAGQGRYRIIEDVNENGVNDDAPLPSFPKTIEYVINWTGGGAITFDRRGTMTGSGTIQLISTTNPDYDCIVIGPAAPATRINMGQWNGGTLNCDQR